MIAEPVTRAEEVGFSAPRLQRIDDVVQAFIDRGVIACADPGNDRAADGRGGADNRYYSGVGGLAGTAEDYCRFGLMLAGGPVTDMRGHRFGLGVKVLENPAEASSLVSRGTFGWSGVFGTQSWIDPAERMVGLMLIQRSLDPTDEELRWLWPRVPTTAYQALED